MNIDKREILKKSFDAIKDHWPDKKDAIRDCIILMALESYDEAVNMWKYVAKRSYELKTLNNDAYELFNLTLYRIRREFNLSKQYSIAYYVFTDSEFCEYMYKYNQNLGDEEVYFIKWLIDFNMPKELLHVLNCIKDNDVLTEYKIGKSLFDAIGKYKESQFTINMQEETKEALVGFIDELEDPIAKSEAYIALMGAI